MVPKQDLTKRFRELVAGLSDTELGAILGITADGARKLRVGNTKTLKLHMALKLARELQISPWYIAGEAEPDARVSGQSSTKARARSATQLDETRAQKAILGSLRNEIHALKSRVERLELALEKRHSR